MNKFSDRFRQLKNESGITLKELSEKLDVTVPNLSYYMKGREPSYDILVKIADYFGVTTDWLIGSTDAKDTTQSSIVSEIEKQLNLEDTDQLSGQARELFLNNQHILYDTMLNMYKLFLLSDDSYVNEHNIYVNMMCTFLASYIKEFNKCVNDLSKDNILNLMKKEELIADAIYPTILLSSYKFADHLAHSETLSEEDQYALQEITKFTLSKYKNDNSDLFDLFLKKSYIEED
jgi:Predicted transcriptional regulators